MSKPRFSTICKQAKELMEKIPNMHQNIKNMIENYPKAAEIFFAEGRRPADLGIRLPGMVAQATSVDMPDEQIIEVRHNGQVFLNDKEYDKPSSQDLPELQRVLRSYKAASEASGNQALVTIWAEDDTEHQRVIDVMNACAAAKIKDVSFAGGN